MKNRILDLLHDVAICFIGGIAVSFIVSVIATMISVVANGFETVVILNAMRSGLLIVGALIMFCVAGVMIGEKSNAKIRSSEKWKEMFRVLGPTFVFLIISVTILSVATIIDYVVWFS